MTAAAEAIAALPRAYRDLFDRARARLEGDERVRGMWLGGSLARGTADAAWEVRIKLPDGATVATTMAAQKSYVDGTWIFKPSRGSLLPGGRVYLFAFSGQKPDGRFGFTTNWRPERRVWQLLVNEARLGGARLPCFQGAYDAQRLLLRCDYQQRRVGYLAETRDAMSPSDMASWL